MTLSQVLRAVVFVAALISAAASGRASDVPFAFGTVEGAGGVPLNVVETGNPAGPELLLIHGMSASYLTWMPQLRSELASRYRIVAFDMRGHGGSGKPWRPEDYAGSQLWADDVAAVIAAKQLKRPLIVAWSFGGHVALAYIRHYGTAHVAGLDLSSKLAGLVTVEHKDPSERYKAILAGSKLRSAPDLEQNIEGYRMMAKGYTAAPLDPHLEELSFLSGLLQPSYVRRAQTGLPTHNEDLGPKITVPVLLSVGSMDEEWPLDAVKAAAAKLPRARISYYEGRGHYVSAEDTPRFNRELEDFVKEALGRAK